MVFKSKKFTSKKISVQEEAFRAMNNLMDKFQCGREFIEYDSSHSRYDGQFSWQIEIAKWIMKMFMYSEHHQRKPAGYHKFLTSLKWLCIVWGRIFVKSNFKQKYVNYHVNYQMTTVNDMW